MRICYYLKKCTTRNDPLEIRSSGVFTAKTRINLPPICIIVLCINYGTPHCIICYKMALKSQNIDFVLQKKKKNVYDDFNNKLIHIFILF